MKALLNQLETKAAEALVTAADAVGVDNYSDVFHQGRAQAYRDAAQLLSKFISTANQGE